MLVRLAVHADEKVNNYVVENIIIEEPIDADSIVRRVMEFSPEYEHVIDEFNADMYVRSRVKVLRRNRLIKAVPFMFRLEKGVKEFMVESMNEIHYTAPDIYDLKVKARTGTLRKNRGEIGSVINYFNINIYSTSLLPNKLLSPITNVGIKHYYYLIDSIWGNADSLRYKVLVVPRHKSNQLVSGYMVVEHGTWLIDELFISGKEGQVTFQCRAEMGKDPETRYRPQHIDVDMLFSFVGNKIEAHYDAVFNYKSVTMWNGIKHRKGMWKKSDCDLSSSFSLSTDSTQIITDTIYMKSVRPYPLSAEEQNLYNDFKFRNDTLLHSTVKKSKGAIFFGELGDALISNYSINLSELGSVKCSPIINPLLFGYSRSNGYSYVQKFKYNYLFSNQKLLRIVPRLGYNFTHKEFYWCADINLVYWPERIGQVSLKVCNGNRIYSSDVVDELKNYQDSMVNFNKLNLDYFKDNFVLLTHKIEIANGLSIEAGFSYHRRTLVDKSDVNNPLLQEQLSGKFRDTYVSFAPRIRIEWAPHMYYYMNGRRKMNLYSRYPTFSIDCERGVKDVLSSVGQYERWEFDMQQEIKLGGMQNFFYRFGCGAFTNQKDLYFADFVNFSRNNLPTGWNDEIGGTFQLLDRRWYNSSDKYARGHVTYESPFLLFGRLRRYTDIIQNERLYAGVLYVPHLLKPYMEIGYGVGTHIFDFGLFSSFLKGKFETIGCKFTFELFNR